MPSTSWVLLASAAALLAISCANPGPPRAPSLHLPETPGDLRAERVGNVVRLAWTTPAETTDNMPIRSPLTAEICRTEPASAPASASPAGSPSPRKTGKHRSPASSPQGSNPAVSAVPSALGAGGISTPVPASTPYRPPAPPVQCLWRLRLPVTPGASSVAVDPLSPLAIAKAVSPPTSDPPRLLAYTVRIENAAGRSAAASRPALAATGAAPAAVTGLRVTPLRKGARIEWQPAPGPGAVALTRQLLEPGTSPDKSVPPAAPGAPQKAAPAHTRHPAPASPPASPRSSSPAPVRLLAAPQSQPDPGGTLDLTAPQGATLCYLAERVRSVAVGGAALEIHGEPSPPVTATLTDTFPPAAPTGLVAVDAGTPAIGPTPAHPAVDLSWEPVTDPDLAGYLVERTEASRATSPRWHQLTPTAIDQPAFHDTTAPSGVALRYRVLAVDLRGNRSAPAAEAAITLTQP